MANYTVNGDDLTDIADAIIAKAGLSGQLEFPDDFVDGIEGISTGTDVSDTTATASDVRTGKYFYTANGTKTQGTIQDQAAQTIHPSTTDQTIASGKYLTGTQTVKGVLLTNLDAGNIKKDVVVKVGDSTDDDCVTSVTGTYEGGSSALAENDVNFYDYDGTLLYSYSATDFGNLSAMPANPSHAGLTSQGWNWSLSDAKTYVASNSILNIGQMYTVTDGKTRLYMVIPEDNFELKICYNMGTASNVITINWGDNSTSDTDTGSGNRSKTHTYSTAGKYVIEISFTGASNNKLGWGSSNSLFGDHASANVKSAKALYKVEIGSNISAFNSRCFYMCQYLQNILIPNTLGSSSTGNIFYGCYSLQHITIPNGNITSFGQYAFDGTYGLKSISIPKTFSNPDNYAFRYCYNLKRITLSNSQTSMNTYSIYNLSSLKKCIIPSSVTTISTYNFYCCYGLTEVTIPSNVTVIGNNSFYNCYGVKEYHLKRSTPPTLGGTNAFYGISPNCVIYVPSASLSAYQTANNWSTYANRMVGE